MLNQSECSIDDRPLVGFTNNWYFVALIGKQETHWKAIRTNWYVIVMLWSSIFLSYSREDCFELDYDYVWKNWFSNRHKHSYRVCSFWLDKWMITKHIPSSWKIANWKFLIFQQHKLGYLLENWMVLFLSCAFLWGQNNKAHLIKFNKQIIDKHGNHFHGQGLEKGYTISEAT